MSSTIHDKNIVSRQPDAFVRLEESGVNIHFQALGEGEDVILIHGLGSNLASWYWTVGRTISRNYRVTMYDLRGHGRSSVPPGGYRLPNMCDDLRGLLDHLNIERAHLVGHSYGARVAMAYAGMNPDRVLSLTVADTQIQDLQPPMRLRDWHYWPTWKKQLRASQTKTMPDENALIDFRLLSEMEGINTAMMRNDSRGAGRRLSMKRRDMGARGGERWRQIMSLDNSQSELADDWPVTKEFVRKITIPTFLVYGSHSHCVATSEELLENMPNSRRVLVPAAGHFHPLVKPFIFTRLLSRFLAWTDRSVVDESVAPMM